MGKMKKAAGYKTVLKQREYMKLLGADVVNRFGDAVDLLAFEWIVYTLTESAAWSSVIFGMNILPTVLLQPIAGTFAERMDKRKLMVLADLLRGFLVTGFAALYFTENLNPWLMLGFTMALSSAEAFRVPAGFAALPKLIDMKYYHFARSLNMMLSTGMQMAGMGLAGVLIGTMGAEAAMGIDAATFFISAFLVSRLNFKPCGGENQTDKNKKKDGGDKKILYRNFWKDFKGGLEYLKNTKTIFNLCLMAVAANAVLTPASALQSPLIIGTLGEGSRLLSVLGIVSALGSVAGGAVYPYLSEKAGTRVFVVNGGVMIALGYVCMAVSIFFKGSTIWVYAAVLSGMFILSAGTQLLISSVGVQFAKDVSREYIARAGGIFNGTATAAVPAASLIVSILSVVFSTVYILLMTALLCAIIFIIIGLKKVRFEREEEKIECQSVQTD